MGILDKIRKKEDKTEGVKAVATPSKAEKKDSKKEAKKIEAKSAKAETAEKKPAVKETAKKKKAPAKENTPLAHFDLIRKPHISEKAFYSVEENKYVFEVAKSANKTEVKKAVENIYHVSVERVNMINVPSKTKMYKGIPGEKSGYKKAIVKLKKGETIDVIEGV